jgi:hypothetical protein
MPHIMDYIEKFKEVVDLLEVIKQGTVNKCGIGYESQDARMVALDSLQLTISSVGMWITGLNSLANTHTRNGRFDSGGFLKSVGSGLTIEQTEMVMYDHLRLGFMTLVHFKIDNLFHNILKHLNALPSRSGYWNLTDALLEQCGMSTKGIEKQELTAFANLRNSLHGNGIHRTSSLKITVDGLTFEFTKDKRVECASWKYIVALLEANVRILNTILLSPNVTAITSEIIDDFASGM